MIFLALFGIPLLVAALIFIFGSGKITLKEFFAQIVAQAMVAAISVATIYWSNTSDTETWNGRISDKKRVRVSCSHSYSCNCHQVCTGSGQNQSCSTHCDTCYEHSFDVDWVIYTTNNENFDIDRVNRQGTQEPPRWTAAKIGEPTSLTHSYENYIKAAPDTLFRHQGLVEKYVKTLPSYPNKVFDYHRMNRMVTLGYVLPDLGQWNAELSEINADLGKSKQANVVVVVVNGLASDYAQALEQHWLGGKKNDVVVVMGAAGQSISWVHVMAWTTNELFKIQLRDALVEVGTLDRTTVLQTIKSHVAASYVRRPMKDFEYLKSSITPTTGQWVFSMVIGVILSLGLSFLFYREDIF